MAKTSQVNRNAKRQAMVIRDKSKRAALKSMRYTVLKSGIQV
jgi:hypothetical protein